MEDTIFATEGDGIAIPPIVSAPERQIEMTFGASDAMKTVPSTANDDERTIDVVWYAGASVPRVNYKTGDPYKLRLDMLAAKLDRLNAGAPVFDGHQSYGGTQAQMGVVRKAWAEGSKGVATLQFKKSDPNAVTPDPSALQADQLWSDIRSGIVQNLSFGAWINKMEADDPEEDDDGLQCFVATDWEPFEISPVTVPADFNTQFLSATSGKERAINPIKEQPVEPITQDAGIARANETELAAVRVEATKAATIAERHRRNGIQLAAANFTSQIPQTFTDELVNSGVTIEEARIKILEKLASSFAATSTHAEHVHVTRDGNAAKFEQMQSAVLLRYNPKFGMSKKVDAAGNSTSEFVEGFGAEYQRKLEDQGRDFRGFSLFEMAKEALGMRGINTRGMTKDQVAQLALQPVGRESYFAGGSESTSDFPAVLANVLNKSLRQAYEAWPQSFRAFGRMVTATDFKPVSRVQLSDLPALLPVNEEGEFKNLSLTDSKQNYSLATLGAIVAISRQTIINDDLQAFTRIPAVMGVSAAQAESNAVWKVITSNQVMTADSLALFHTTHKNLLSGGGSVLGLSSLGPARAQMRLQTGPQGTPLNLVPRYIAVPAGLETAMLQMIVPINIASTDVTKVVPDWVRSLVPIVEPRLDAASATAWYLIADPAQIDTIEYCYLEGQEGVYIETKQGFDVDGIQTKVRLDFAAAAIDFRGLQKNAGA